MSKILFTGCSFTAGNGWNNIDPEVEHKESLHLWTNLCYNNINIFKDLEILNLGKGGASNTEIFEITVDALSTHGSDIDFIFCQWTSGPRYNFRVGFELWDTSENFAVNIDHNKHDIKLSNGEQYSRSYINDLTNRLKTLHHLHWEICKIIKYSNVIINLAKMLGIEHIFFINGLCPWDQNYFVELTNVKPESYTNFTKTEILNIKHRSDEDIYKLYSLLHQHYREAGSINEAHWINLYNSFLKNKTDVNFDQSHPGINSNQTYFQIIDNSLKQSNLYK